MARPDFLSPLHLFAPVAPFPINGSEQSPDPQLLLNPNKSAMLIDQFRFSGAVPSLISTGSLFYPRLALWDFLYLGVDIRLGSIPLTNGVVPIPAIVPRYNGFPVQRGFDPATPIGDVVGQAFNYDAVMTWHLPRPLYVPPGVQLYVRFVRQDVFATGNRATSIENISFSAVGRSMPTDYPIPKKIWVPWATATQCKQHAAPFPRFVSTDQELANPNTELLHVTSLNGFNCAGDRDPAPDNFSVPVHSPLTAQMTLSSGKMLMRDPTNFFTLFPTDRGVLNLDATLQSKEFVRCELELVSPLGPADTGVNNTIEYSTIGMIGYREVQTPIGVQP